MAAVTDITVVGAGPYGLSIGAHLATVRGLDFRIIGKPMQSWMTRMPKGMHLKSAGFASNLCDRNHQFSLERYANEERLPYDDFNIPVPLAAFSSYGLAFQRRYLPHLEQDRLVVLRRSADGFELHTENGATFSSKRVILAVGLDDFAHMPPVLRGLSTDAVSHSSDHHHLERFRNQEVVVLGGGSSAIDMSVLLQDAQARVVQVVRAASTDFSGIWREPSTPWWSRLRTPVSGIGPGWRNRLCTDLPHLFRYLPDHLRMRIVARHLGPSGGWFMTRRAEAVPRLTGHAVQNASLCGSRVKLQLASKEGKMRDITADHVIAATGYKVDLSRLDFLDSDLRSQLKLIQNYPRLMPDFESSVPGLHFAGPITAGSFGPVMRFVYGAAFTSRRIAGSIGRPRRREPLSGRAPSRGAYTDARPSDSA